MLELIFFIPKEAQKKMMLEFIKPTFSELLNTGEISSFVYTSYPKRLILEVFTTEENQVFNEQISTKWKQYLQSEYEYFAAFKMTEVQTLFREFPQDYIKILEHEHVDESDPFYTKDTSLLNLEILECLVENEYDFEYSLCLVFTYLYCLGGYAPKIYLEQSKELLNTIEFFPSTKEKLNAEVTSILNENEKEIKERLDELFIELNAFHELESAPTTFSKWKLSYGMLTNNTEIIDITLLFEKFRNQLFFSDAEIYMISTIIINYFEEKYCYNFV
ncbi:hypothetical protein U8527_14565 [Kordia algicida OT-1]|uniref:Uncharacterized protein n=1 Tax=Kordia algicida OT-1 TaxID=391587 RepID=A9DYG9_9FLAO|nr:hypothetical protein [Kordia algicida]EDP96131.1 hypothetical protein KAOT1_08178 [Kordia algicida OT-1]